MWIYTFIFLSDSISSIMNLYGICCFWYKSFPSKLGGLVYIHSEWNFSSFLYNFRYYTEKRSYFNIIFFMGVFDFILLHLKNFFLSLFYHIIFFKNIFFGYQQIYISKYGVAFFTSCYCERCIFICLICLEC